MIQREALACAANRDIQERVSELEAVLVGTMMDMLELGSKAAKRLPEGEQFEMGAKVRKRFLRNREATTAFHPGALTSAIRFPNLPTLNLPVGFSPVYHDETRFFITDPGPYLGFLDGVDAGSKSLIFPHFPLITAQRRAAQKGPKTRKKRAP